MTQEDEIEFGLAQLGPGILLIGVFLGLTLHDYHLPIILDVIAGALATTLGFFFIVRLGIFFYNKYDKPRGRTSQA